MNAALGVARIGPNAITQVAGALERAYGAGSMRELLNACGLGAYADVPPAAMVDELEVIALHRTLRERLPARAALGIEQAAGRRTADYLLSARIPRAAQRLLRLLPARLASPLLLSAIGKHAWTFTGSGRFHATAGKPVVITIEGCPMCCGAHATAPICDYYAASFARLFSVLVHPNAAVVETRCIAAGAPDCRFEVDWR
jgi:divinyl protochlorophyllide a 8-vinyl-reductase